MSSSNDPSYKPASTLSDPPKFGFERWKDRGDYQFGYKRIGESDDEDDQALYKPVNNRADSREPRKSAHEVDSKYVRRSSGSHPLRMRSTSQDASISTMAARYEELQKPRHEQVAPSSQLMEVQRSVSREPRPNTSVPLRYPEADRPRDASRGPDQQPVYMSRFGRDMSAKGHDVLSHNVSGTTGNYGAHIESVGGRSSANEAERAANLRDERVRPYRSTSNDRARPGAEQPGHSSYMRQLQEHKYGAEEQPSNLISAKYIQQNMPTTLSDTYVSRVDASAFNTSQQFLGDFQMPSVTHVGPASRAGSVSKAVPDLLD